MLNTLQLSNLVPTLIAILAGLYMLWLGATPIWHQYRLVRRFKRTTGKIAQIHPRNRESELIVIFKDASNRSIEISCNREGKFSVGDLVTIFYPVDNPLDAVVQVGSPFGVNSLLSIIGLFVVGCSLVIYGLQRILAIW